ncbi:torsin-1A-interacting protein 2-like isoform X3 [Xiphophorus hellerii]|uniref:torsin-1A-interacting protein 2-like isoform X3 n=1 Tax=Xiphophorus hellerii TaxID=8084 RepID=UPI0013B3BCA3|nr:torsin-1A-interacting protein 2-like isoform X3 [Xiphophorus hellerii]
MDSPPGYQQPKGSADPSAELSGADSDEGKSSPAVDKNSGQQTNDESQDNSSNGEKSTDEPPSRSVTTVKSEEAEYPPEMDKTNNYQADDEQQGYSKGDPSETQKPVGTKPDECANQRGMKLLVGVAIVALVAIVAQHYLQSESQPQKTDWQQVDVFLKQMKKVKEKFTNQRAELWSRSEIHLKRHLQTSQPAEPVSLILTSGVRAERTMRCLAQGLASAFSTARNASVLHIDGAGKAGQDSDQVKLDIDRKLQGAFEGDKPVAVIHRLEELPPGSTLIFYRYCDHENAAYKKTFLIFTVLLGDEEEIPAEMRLSIVEEMVDDYLQKKFLSHGHPVSFDRMDVNKYGGLWSRISHLILPVAAEDRIEHEGC